MRGTFRRIPPRPWADEIAPADRMPRFIGLPEGVAAERALEALRVLVVGAGSIGARVADGLARAGVGAIALADPKRFSSNVSTQALRGPAEVGRLKATTVASWLRRVAPRCELLVLDERIQALPWPCLDDFDAVVAATDLLGAETWLGQRCRWLGMPLWLAAVHGESMTAQIRRFGNAGDAAACPACAYNATDWALLDAEVRFSCDGGAARPPAEVAARPTRSIAALCSLAADLAVMEIVRTTLRLGAPAADLVLEHNGYSHRTILSPLAPSAGCRADHRVLRRAWIDRSPADLTLRQCAAAAGLDPCGAETASFDVGGGMAFVHLAACRRCGAEEPVARFVAGGPWSAAGARLRSPCTACGARSLAAHPFHTSHPPVPGTAGPGLLDVPLARLGATGHGVVVHGADRAALVRRRREVA